MFCFSSSVDTCQTLPPGVGLFLVQSDTCPAGNEVSYGSVCSYNCTEGYVIQGGSSLTCGEDGQWLQTLPQCEGQCRWCCNFFLLKKMYNIGDVGKTLNNHPVQILPD